MTLETNFQCTPNPMADTYYCHSALFRGSVVTK